MRKSLIGICLAISMGLSPVQPAGKAAPAKPKQPGMESVLISDKAIKSLPKPQEKQLERVHFFVALVEDAKTMQAIAKAAARSPATVLEKPLKVDWNKEAVLVVIQAMNWDSFTLKGFAVADGTGTLSIQCRPIIDRSQIGPGPSGTVTAAIQVVQKKDLKKLKVMLDLGKAKPEQVAAFDLAR